MPWVVQSPQVITPRRKMGTDGLQPIQVTPEISQWHMDPSCISGSTKPASQQFAVRYGLRIHWDWRRFSNCFQFVNCIQGYHCRLSYILSLCTAFRFYLAHHLPRDDLQPKHLLESRPQPFKSDIDAQPPANVDEIQRWCPRSVGQLDSLSAAHGPDRVIH